MAAKPSRPFDIVNIAGNSAVLRRILCFMSVGPPAEAESQMSDTSTFSSRSFIIIIHLTSQAQSNQHGFFGLARRVLYAQVVLERIFPVLSRTLSCLFFRLVGCADLAE